MLTNSKFSIKKRLILCISIGIISIVAMLNILGILHFNIIIESKIKESVISNNNKNIISNNVVKDNVNQEVNNSLSNSSNIMSNTTVVNNAVNSSINNTNNNELEQSTVQKDYNIDKSKYKIYALSGNDLKRMSGRNEIWKVGFDLLKQSPLNIIFGVGRFRSTNLLKFNDREFTQFHNIYLDITLTGGIVELIFVGYIFFSVIKKIMKSNLEKSIKITYIIAYLIYAIYIVFESCGRFSIGGVDTLCIIFFIAIPLLWSNSKSKENGGKN